MYFWKDRTGNEIDAIADLDSRLLPVEAKSGLTLASDAFDGLRFWLDLPGNPNHSGVVVYRGVESYLTNGITALPWLFF